MSLSSHPSSASPAGGAFSISAPTRTVRADVVVHVTGLPRRSNVQAIGGVVPIQGVVRSNGAADLDVPLFPGQVNALEVRALIGRQVKDVSFLVRQDRAAASRGVLTGRVETLGGHPVRGALVSYGSSATRSDGTGHFRLRHLPQGQVAAVISASGYSTGLSIGTVAATWAGLTTDTRLAALPAPRVVGRDGTTFRGDGWTVTVPPGALTRPREMRVGALPYTGLIDQIGPPIVQITPVDLRFAKPVTVTLGAGTVGSHLDAGAVLAVDPGTLHSDHPTITATNATGYSITITNPDQIRLAGTAAPDDPTQCLAYPAGDDPAATLNAVRKAAQAYMAAVGEPGAWQLYDTYLSPGATSPGSPVEITDAAVLNEFKTDPATIAAKLGVLTDLVDHLRTGPPELRDPTDPAGGDLAQFKPGQGLGIDWANPWTAPGLIAGDVGTSHDGREEDRSITGRYQIIPDVTRNGVLRAVTLRERNLKLDVHDAIDFCPGDLGAPIERVLTVPMSRLEATPYPSGGFYAKSVYYHLSTALTSEPMDLTSQYPGNDRDRDGIPDTEPWPGAPYQLDNCPHAFNPDQRDSVGDGIGDACRPSPVRSPSSRSSSGSTSEVDSQIVSFTNSAPKACVRNQKYTVTFTWRTINTTGVTAEIDGAAASGRFGPTDSLTLQYTCNDWPHTLWITATGVDGKVVSDVNVVAPDPIGSGE